MVCTRCKTENSLECDLCSTCGEALHDLDDNSTRVLEPMESEATIVVSSGSESSLATGVHGWSSAGDHLPGAGGEVSLVPGSLLGGRYEIEKTLGQGGMGAVYKARDREVDRLVAIKIIRPELANDPRILQRFKQELVLARQVTHRNVVRIYDLGVADGLRFISMEYIEGRELNEVLDECGKFEPKKAAEIILQVVCGLEAAHNQGVVHRDLKPQNIMLDNSGRAAVMDFGIASSIGATAAELGLAASGPSGDSSTQIGSPQMNLTQMGSLLGTPRYMSPEQARCETVDGRSDIFTLGIIFYEMLTGSVPFAARTVKQTLLKRTTETATPPIQLEPGIPKRVNEIVVKCLQPTPEKRYQNTTELVADLEVWLGIRSGVASGQMTRWRLGASAMAVVALLASAFVVYRETIASRSKPHDPVKVLISDFRNTTGEPLLQGSIEPMLQVGLEGASFITSFNRGEAHKLAAKLKPGLKDLDENTARLLGIREGLNVVVNGSVDRHGDGYRLSASAVEPAKGKLLVSKDADFARLNDLQKAVDTVAGGIRRSLGDYSSAPNSSAETFTSASLAAAQKYAEGQQYQWDGKWDKAVESWREATRLDPNMSRAYAGLGAVLANLGNRKEAAHNYELALAHIDRESDREKYRTRGGYYLLQRDYQKAAEQFRQLVKAYPADSAGLANLALAYFYGRNMPGALEEGRKAVDIYPTNLLQLNNLGLYAMYAGDFDTAIKESKKIISINPQFEKAYLCMGLSQLGSGQLNDALGSYGKMAGLSDWGASEAHLAFADLDLYQGKFSDATSQLLPGIKSDVEHKNSQAAALKLIVLAEAQLHLDQHPQALESAEKAVSMSDDETILYSAATVDLRVGEKSRAAALSATLSNRFGPSPQALAKLIDGAAQLESGRNREAVATFQEAQKLDDSWLGRYHLGRAYLQAKQYPDAENEFDVCVKRMGEATAVFLDDEPSMRYLPAIFYFRGLAREGLHSPGAKDDFKKFLAIKQSSEHDSMVSDAKSRLHSSN